MEFGQYSIEFDRTGFPMIRREDWDYHISLFPVSKYQFERFLSDTGPKGKLYTDKWYRALLDISPRRTWQDCKDKIWQLFITGLSLNEIKPFLRYLGKDFRLPTSSEWLELHKVSDEIKTLPISADLPPANLWLKEELFPLTEQGLLEMVIENNKILCIGKPYQELLPNTWQPEEIKEPNWELCKQVVGFRVVHSP